MKGQEFDEVLERCLSLLDRGATVEECVAPYPQYADELRAQLGVAQTLIAARPQMQPDPSAQGRGGARWGVSAATGNPNPGDWFVSSSSREERVELRGAITAIDGSVLVLATSS